MSTSQIINDKKLIQIDFSHRFAEWEDPHKPDHIETIIWMADRALGVLRLLEVFLEHECGVTVHAVSSVDAIVAELEDIKSVARAIKGED